jgi:hypothetical protein
VLLFGREGAGTYYFVINSEERKEGAGLIMMKKERPFIIPSTHHSIDNHKRTKEIRTIIIVVIMPG